ncbi:MAG: hypothetical protein ACLSUW_09275 [Akkermansia sp.]
MTEAASPPLPPDGSAKANKAAYRNTSWDLVDLYEEQGSRAVEEGQRQEFSEELKGRARRREAAVKEKAEEQARLQKKIAEVGRRRDTWLNKWKAEQALPAEARRYAGRRHHPGCAPAGRREEVLLWEENVPYSPYE